MGRITGSMFAQAELQDKRVYTDCATVRSLAGRGVRLKQFKKSAVQTRVSSG